MPADAWSIGVPMFRPVAIIPVYNHERAIGDTLAAVLSHGLDCVMVDDGSHAPCAAVLRGLAARHPDRVRLVVLAANQGKGGAMMAGFDHAAEAGYTHALQIDADGQHDAARIAEFVAQAAARPDAMICGYPVYDDTVPRARLIARYLTHVWVWINTLSTGIRDAMCGMRVYPLAPTVALLRSARLGRRMEFDIEVLVRMSWRGVPIVNVPTRVTYPADGVSHFAPWRDNALISAMHARLFAGMLWRAPLLLLRKVRG